MENLPPKTRKMRKFSKITSPNFTTTQKQQNTIQKYWKNWSVWNNQQMKNLGNHQNGKRSGELQSKWKTKKSPGPNKISPEAFKTLDGIEFVTLTNIIYDHWTNEDNNNPTYSKLGLTIIPKRETSWTQIITVALS